MPAAPQSVMQKQQPALARHARTKSLAQRRHATAAPAAPARSDATAFATPVPRAGRRIRPCRRSDPPGGAGQSRSRQPFASGDAGTDAGGPAHPAGGSGRPADVPAGHRRADALHQKAAGGGGRRSSTGCPTASRSAAIPAAMRQRSRQSTGNSPSARADAARAHAPEPAGWPRDRIYEVAGKAGSEPLLPEDPNASANRRLTILLLREAPPRAARADSSKLQRF